MKRKSKSQPPRKKGAPQWMVTYSDMMTLILVFFVLLFGISQVDNEKFDAVANSFRERGLFEFYPSPIQFESPDKKGTVEEGYGEEGMKEDEFEELIREINKFIEENDLGEIMVANRIEQGVVLVLPEKIFFDPGKADLLDPALPFLDRVAELIKNLSNDVKVEGHTDNVPMNSYQYPSNWELSAARASRVVRYFIDNHGLDPDRFIATGYADTEPVAPNDTPENRQKNRRVEIIIMRSNDNQEKQGKE